MTKKGITKALVLSIQGIFSATIMISSMLTLAFRMIEFGLDTNLSAIIAASTVIAAYLFVEKYILMFVDKYVDSICD